MVDKNKLKRAEEKLSFAEYLTRSGHTDTYCSAARKHVLNASKLAIQALTDTRSDSPRKMQQALLRFEEPEARTFAKNFMNACKQGSTKNDRRSIKLALRDVQQFIEWIRENQQM